MKREKLALHGWHFSIHDRRLEILNQETGKFEIFDKKITHTDIKHVSHIRLPAWFPGRIALGVGVGSSVAIAGGIWYAQQKHDLQQPAFRLNDPVLSTTHASELERRIEYFR